MPHHRAEARGRRLLRVGQPQAEQLSAGCVDDPRGVVGVGEIREQSEQLLGEVPANLVLGQGNALVQLRWSAFGWEEEQPPGRGVAVDRTKSAVERVHERVALGVVRLGLQGLDELRRGPVGFPVDQSDEQAAEVTEVLVEDGPGDAGSLGDPGEGGRVEPLGVDDLVRDVEDLLASLVRSHASTRSRDGRHVDSITDTV